MKAQLISKMSKVIVATGLAVMLGVGVVAQPAAALRLYATGPVGYVALPTGTCTYYNGWNRLDVTVPTPTIYAPDQNWGAGNDAAWTRYQVHVVNRYGSIVRTSSFSGWAAAYDNQPATFSGASLTFTDIPEYSTVAIGVEWSPGGRTTGAAVYKLDKYVLYSGGMGPYGGVDSCSKWTWTPR